MRKLFKENFANPLTLDLNIDSEEAIVVHRRIIKENLLLNKHYLFIYSYFKRIEDSLSTFNLPSLEIGSGGGFLKEVIPTIITSDIVKSSGINRIENAIRLSFPDSSLKAVYANGVLHHVKDPGLCLEEIQRVLVSGGVFVCNEPSSSYFGYFMNKYFHNEYTNKSVKEWKIETTKNSARLTDANMAMPYIIFKRDRAVFEERFKNLKIVSIIYHDFLRYMLSGGLSYKTFIPAMFAGLIDYIEKATKAFMPFLGSNMLVTIQKI